MKSLLLISAIGPLNLLSVFSIVLPVGAGFIKLKLLEKEYRFLFAFFILSCAVDIIALQMSMNRENNLALGNIFYLVECFSWSIILLQWLPSKALRITIFIFLAAYLVVWYLTSLFEKGDLEKFNSFARTIEGFAFVFFSCFLLITVSTDTREVIFKNPKFWFGSGLLIYFSVNLIVFGTVNYILSNHAQIMNNTWMIHSFTNIFANLLFAIGFLWIKPKPI
jgi:hypothetical protein